MHDVIMHAVSLYTRIVIATLLIMHVRGDDPSYVIISISVQH